MLVRWTSIVRWVTKSACAISRFVGPEAASSATRRSLGVSEATPLRAIRRGRAPVASSSCSARAASCVAPQIVASSTAWRVTHRWCGTTDRQQPHAARASTVPPYRCQTVVLVAPGGRKRAPEHERRRAHRTRSKCRWAIVCATDMPRATRPVPQRIPMTVSGSVSDQRSNDGGERVGRAGADDEVGEADFLPSPLDFLACRRRVSGEDGQ
jgi:hypothetical protein